MVKCLKYRRYQERKSRGSNQNDVFPRQTQKRASEKVSGGMSAKDAKIEAESKRCAGDVEKCAIATHKKGYYPEEK